MITSKINFPAFTGIKCNMMPFVQGDASSLPEIYRPYADIINSNYLEKGEVGLLTIDESFVEAGKSQRGYNAAGINRNVHIEVGHVGDITAWGDISNPEVGWGSGSPMSSPKPSIGWGGGVGWGSYKKVLLDSGTEVLIANNISDTCRLWNTKDYRWTNDGDLAAYIMDYPKHTGILMKAGEVAKISIFTPHECILQSEPGPRQFFRIVGKGVHGREDYFTINPLMEAA